ncbi:MAG: hypothetical protein NTX53_07645 [candidate division WOR-3 bacterium]|nr:hypothetical protein [candidate division WOR-3 bacterium]
MGLFVLHSDSTKVDKELLRRLFVKKGFLPPDEMPMGQARLMFSERPGVPPPTWYRSREGWSLHYVGTLAYRSLGYRAGVKRFLDDFAGDSVDDSELVGSFCAIVFDGSRVRLQTDTAGLCHVFSNREGTVISNSLQAVLSADGRRHTLNRDALLEQLLTGSIAGPDTLFTDIVLLTQDKQRSFRSPTAGFSVADSTAVRNEPCRESFSECVEHQLAVLRKYFDRIRALSEELGTSLGISGGYDSRLLLLLAKEAGLPIFAHTFSSPAHEQEQTVAEELTRYAGVPLSAIPIRTWMHLNDQRLRANMDDALFYWDGRTNMTMGGFNDVNTRAVRIKAMGSAGLGLNGLGGELYRNREHLKSGSLDFGQWFRYLVMGPDCTAAIRDRESTAAVVDRLGRKYARLMGMRQLKSIDRYVARRWYRDVWLPYSAGPRLSAENQLSFALMPFADRTVSSEALCATPLIGTGGAFEAAMIRALDRGAAGITSNYGHAFDHVSLRTRLSDGVKSWVPLGPKLRFHMKKAVSSVSTQYLGNTREPPPGVQEGLRVLKEINLPVNWDVLLSDDVNRDRCYYIAYFLSSFREHLSFDSGGTTEF